MQEKSSVFLFTLLIALQRLKERFYTEQDIELVKQIKFIRDDLHITRIEAIQTELKQRTKKTDSRQRAAEILLKVRKQLEEIRSLI